MMKANTIPLLIRLGRASERCFGPLTGHPGPRRGSVYQEMRLGAAVGLLACLGYAGLGGASVPLVLLAGVLGLGIGGVIGLLLWGGSSDFPDDPVLPPARGQERRSRPAAQSLRRAVARP